MAKMMKGFNENKAKGMMKKMKLPPNFMNQMKFK